jgi:hypothetical protein
MDKNKILKMIFHGCEYNTDEVIKIAIEAIDLAFADMDSEGQLARVKYNFQFIENIYNRLSEYTEGIE